jgi:hypothetical protein
VALGLFVCSAAPALAAAPANDDFDSATVIGSLPYADSLDTTEATYAGDEPAPCGQLYTSVWYAFTPTHDMRLTAEAVGTGDGYVPDVSAWTGARNTLSSVLASDSDQCPHPYEFGAKSGTTYFFLVGNIDSTLGGQLDFSLDGSLLTTLGLSTSHPTIKYKRSVRVTAHLADFADLTTKTVSIYKTPYSGAKTLVKTAAVDSLGNLSAVVTLTKNTKFVAEWAGEDGWLPAKSKAKTVGVHVLASTKISGNYGTSGKYKLFHAGDTVKQTGTVRPNPAGKSLRFIAQQHLNGGWRTIATANFRIKSTGSVNAYLTAPRGTFRARNQFVGDADHLGDTSAWRFFRGTP